MISTCIDIIKEHFEWRHQIFKLAKADIVKTYSGAALGWAWGIIKPTITIFVFWFAFSFGLRAGRTVDEYPFLLWLIAGMLPWFYMSEMITQGASAIRKYSYLVTKMKFPVSTIPTFVSLSKLVVHLFLFAITLIIFAMFGYLPDIYMLQLPFYMFMMVFFAMEWSLFSSMLSSISQDFLNLVRSIVTPIFWLSGIMWDINSIHIGWLKIILKFNPVTYIATGYRNVFIYKTWFWNETESLLCFACVTVVMILLAIWSYRKLMKEIPDVL